MTWEVIRHRIGKGLNDPSLTKYGNKIRSVFAMQYRSFVLEAAPEELEITRDEKNLQCTLGYAEYTLPRCIRFIGVIEKNGNRLIPMDYDRFQQAVINPGARTIANPYLTPDTDEIYFYKDNNVLKFLSSPSRTSMDIYIQYVPDFDFVSTTMSESAIGTIIELSINHLAGRYEHTESNK